MYLINIKYRTFPRLSRRDRCFVKNNESKTDQSNTVLVQKLTIDKLIMKLIDLKKVSSNVNTQSS